MFQKFSQKNQSFSQHGAERNQRFIHESTHPPLEKDDYRNYNNRTPGGCIFSLILGEGVVLLGGLYFFGIFRQKY